MTAKMIPVDYTAPPQEPAVVCVSCGAAWSLVYDRATRRFRCRVQPCPVVTP